MFRSIRGRLIASTVVLTVLAVTLVGVLALSLIERHVDRQERDYLTANAEAVARQALPLVQAGNDFALDQLARTAAFLGNARVRILDRGRQVLIDSGAPRGVDEFVWIAPPFELGADAVAKDALLMAQSLGKSPIDVPLLRLREQFPLLEQLPPGTRLSIVQRVDSPWGSRFSFDVQADPNPDPQPDPPPASEPALRSTTVVSVPIGSTDQPLGYVELSAGPDFGDATLVATRQAFVFAGGGATLIAAVVGLLVGRGLTNPLRELTTAAGQMSAGDLSTRAPVASPDEIGQLAQQFNQMAERLEISFVQLAAERDTLRRFIADASHELRTPLTALKNFNELLQGTAADDAQARAEFLAESRAQLHRLDWITHNLLSLSRLDAGLIALELAEHDAGDLIESAASPFKTLAQEKGIALTLNPPASPLTLRCDRARIEMALSNLLDNAVKFTPRGGRIEIGAELVDNAVRLWVRDTGPGIDPEDRPRLFERFYQGRAVKRLPHNNGSGLGLAIVQSIVQAHGGRVEVESESGAGSRFVIELPLSSSVPKFIAHDAPPAR